jgi:hypothetical protein
MNTDINVIYNLYRKYVLLNFNKFHFLSIMLVIHFSEKGP